MLPSQNTVVFRADASAQIGGGHVVRCLALAHVLHARGWHCAFVGIKDVVQTVPQILSAPVIFIELADPQDDTPEQLCKHWPEGISCLVVDHYGRDHSYESAWRPWANVILAIDDLANRQHDCDLLLDQTYGRQTEDYSSLVPQHCQLLLGADYALLREPFARLRARSLQRRRVTSQIQRVLISFGAADTGDITTIALASILAGDVSVAVDVVVGAQGENLDKFRQIALSHPGRVTIHRAIDAEQMAELMCDADLAVGACGTSSWERCVLGVPTLGIVTADNQRMVAQRLAQCGAMVLLNDFNAEFAALLTHEYGQLRNYPARLVEMSRSAAQICFGNGAVLVARKIQLGCGGF